MTDEDPPPLRRLSGTRYLAEAPGAPQLPSLPAPQLDGFTPSVRALAAEAWTLRAEEEHRSAAIFGALGAAVLVDGFALDLAGLVSGTVADELRHAALCAELAQRFAASTPRVRMTRVVRRLERRPEPRWRALAILFVEGAIGETISSALFNAGRHATTEPCSRAALAHIARDEARHARRFWEALATLTLDDGDRARLQEEVRQAFAHLEQGILPSLRRLEAGEPFDAALAQLGVLAPERRVDAFYHALEVAVRPRLRHLGLDDERAWRDRYAASPERMT
jgi:hypothetical protein